ncbi:leucine-rich repeat protein [Hallella faecis]|uniref:leucine-rich repeat protein n=1 Tax=Hallella faecis TaxID=2841596 RepID=UPI003F93F2F3
MQYPLISEYIEAIRYAEDNFDKLSNLRPVLDDNGKPVMSSGNFAVVFKMKDIETGKMYAVKCFTREQEEREERYREIIKVLEHVKSPYFVSTQYYDKELFVDTSQGDETEFPVLVMDWVDGYPVDQFIQDNISNKYRLQLLTYNFCQLGVWLLSQQIAHGDLKPDNIIVREDFSLVLVDYDGMFIPAFYGKSALEVGSPDFQNPNRSISTFNRNIDDFSIALIALSLKSIALSPTLYEKSRSNALITSARDYADLSKSDTLVSLLALSNNKDFAQLFSSFILAYSNKELYPKFHTLIAIEEPLRSNVTDDDIENSFTDELGIRFSNDRKRLIKFPEELAVKQYEVPQGIEVICDWAFSKKSKRGIIGIDYPNAIILPESLRMIGFAAFGCLPISTMIIPENVEYIEDYAFAGSESLKEIKLSSNCNYLGKHAFYNCMNLIDVYLPKKIEIIEEGLFCGCESLEKIYIPDKVRSIKEAAFQGCLSLKKIRFPKNIESIAKDALWNCAKQSIYNTYKHRTFLERQILSWDADYQLTDTLTIFANCDRAVFSDVITSKYSPYLMFEKSIQLEIFYHQKWNLKDKRKFSEEELNAVLYAIVVKTDYGYSVEFHMKSGCRTYIPLSSDSTIQEGDIIHLDKAYVLTLSKLGEKDIYRVEYIEN